jgi:hypothetical protein
LKLNEQNPTTEIISTWDDRIVKDNDAKRFEETNFSRKFSYLWGTFPEKHRVIESSIISQKKDLQDELIVFIGKSNIQEIQFLKDLAKEKRV